jgi:membrane-associated protease RseP (regulator of RpoE activity)
MIESLAAPEINVNTDRFTGLVNRVMDIEDITAGSRKDKYLYRYHGHLRGDSSAAYDELAAALRPLAVTPLFRLEDERQTILIADWVIDPRPSNPWINLGLFALTVLSVLFAGAMYTYSGPMPAGTLAQLATLARNIGAGVPFAVSLLSILLAHEFGHYLAGRYHGARVTLPYFIPFPFSLFGTLGAAIQLKEPPKNRRILLDIGVAGPLAGLVVAIPVLLIGLALSKVEPFNPSPGSGFLLEGNSLLYLLSKFVVFGQMLPSPASYGSSGPLLYWLRYFFTGLPLPLGGADVQLHSIAWAGWAGLLVTALNLIPAGQLDGGHLVYVLLGRRARMLLPFILVILIGMGFFWSGWWLWAGLIFFLGRSHAEPFDQITPLDTPRKLLAVAGLALFVLVFTPVPLIQSVAGLPGALGMLLGW